MVRRVRAAVLRVQTRFFVGLLPIVAVVETAVLLTDVIMLSLHSWTRFDLPVSSAGNAQRENSQQPHSCYMVRAQSMDAHMLGQKNPTMCTNIANMHQQTTDYSILTTTPCPKTRTNKGTGTTRLKNTGSPNAVYVGIAKASHPNTIGCCCKIELDRVRNEDQQ